MANFLIMKNITKSRSKYWKLFKLHSHEFLPIGGGEKQFVSGRSDDTA